MTSSLGVIRIMYLEPFKTYVNIDKFKEERVWNNRQLEVIVDPNESKVKFVLNNLTSEINYTEYCDLLDKLFHLKKRLKKHHHNGLGLIGKRNKLKKQIEDLQYQLKQLDNNLN